jgi:hypothetical protein
MMTTSPGREIEVRVMMRRHNAKRSSMNKTVDPRKNGVRFRCVSSDPYAENAVNTSGDGFVAILIVSTIL